MALDNSAQHAPQNALISAAELRAMLGISEMSLWRWLRDPTVDFPRPFVVKNRRYWREAEVNQWLEARRV